MSRRAGCQLWSVQVCAVSIQVVLVRLRDWIALDQAKTLGHIRPKKKGKPLAQARPQPHSGKHEHSARAHFFCRLLLLLSRIIGPARGLKNGPRHHPLRYSISTKLRPAGRSELGWVELGPVPSSVHLYLSACVFRLQLPPLKTKFSNGVL